MAGTVFTTYFSVEMSRLVEGKVALVTGAATGIGRASALLFAREGARVVVSDVNAEAARETVEKISKDGGQAHFVQTDVSDEPAVEALVNECVEVYGRLDCAHNNAGIQGTTGPLHEIDLDGWNRTLAINLTGVFLCMKHEIRVMLDQGSGAIVNTSSGGGVIAVPNLSPYCASTHAILGLTKTAAVENARTGIRINAVCPGSTDTPMLQGAMASPEIKKLILASQPGGRLGTPEEIAEATVWLCSERASFVSGESMLVDGAAIAR